MGTAGIYLGNGREDGHVVHGVRRGREGRDVGLDDARDAPHLAELLVVIRNVDHDVVEGADAPAHANEALDNLGAEGAVGAERGARVVRDGPTAEAMAAALGAHARLVAGIVPDKRLVVNRLRGMLHGSSQSLCAWLWLRCGTRSLGEKSCPSSHTNCPLRFPFDPR